MEKIGVVFGCFIPLHDGHKHLINEALRENDKVIIAVCGYDDDRGKDFIPFSDRYELMLKRYGNYSGVYVVKVDDHAIGLTGLFDHSSWEKWGDEVFIRYFTDYNMSVDFSTECTWYTGELDYVEKLSAIYKEDNFKYYSRQRIKVSSTDIRNNYEKYKHMVDDSFREYIKLNGIR